jgi:hypothetical protein
VIATRCNALYARTRSDNGLVRTYRWLSDELPMLQLVGGLTLRHLAQLVKIIKAPSVQVLIAATG